MPEQVRNFLPHLAVLLGMQQKPKVGVVGYGYVGKAVHAFFKNSTSGAIYDPALGFTDKDTVNACDFAIVCVPTPMQPDGAVDLSYIKDSLSWLKTPLIVIKSTVPPGTTAKLIQEHVGDSLICFSPEYIGEGNYPVPYWDKIPHPTDMTLHAFHIFGGDKKATNKAIEYWKRAAGPFAKFMQTDSTTAELVKYMENAWIATKITFVNEFFDIAGAFGADYNELRELWLMDGRIGASHTLVYENKRGFDGKCIPKDTNGIVSAATAKGYKPKLLTEVLQINEEFLKKNQ
jgi:UDPglucose 6-dehydrogenase